MKKLSKRLLSLVLVGVTMFSLLSFSNSNYANAASESRGTIQVIGRRGFDGCYYIKFLDKDGNQIGNLIRESLNLDGYRLEGNKKIKSGDPHNIPDNAVTIKVNLVEYGIGLKEAVLPFEFKLNSGKVTEGNEKIKIDLVGGGEFWDWTIDGKVEASECWTYQKFGRKVIWFWENAEP